MCVTGSVFPGWTSWICTIAFPQSCPQPYLLMLMTEALDGSWTWLISSLFWEPLTDPVTTPLLCSAQFLGWSEEPWHSALWDMEQTKMCPWMFLNKDLLWCSAMLKSSLFLRTLWCDDLGSEGVDIQMSGKLTALFPRENKLRIFETETWLFYCSLCLVAV